MNIKCYKVKLIFLKTKYLDDQRVTIHCETVKYTSHCILHEILHLEGFALKMYRIVILRIPYHQRRLNRNLYCCDVIKLNVEEGFYFIEVDI